MPIGGAYQPLADYLSSKKENIWEATFHDVERVVGRPLPDSAYRYQAWWANQDGRGHSQTHGWRSVGWRTARLDLERKCVRFERDAVPAKVTATVPPSEIDEELVRRAMVASDINDRGEIINRALQAFIHRQAAAYIISLSGSMPDFAVPARERPNR